MFYFADLTCPLIAALSGFHTLWESQNKKPEYVDVIMLVYTHMLRMARCEFPHAAVFATRIVSPTIYAATWEYTDVVRYLTSVLPPS